MLREIRAYLRERGRASLKDMAHHLGHDEAALRHALSQWQCKGHVRALPAGTPCRGCRLCQADEIELFACLDAPLPAPDPG